MQKSLPGILTKKHRRLNQEEKQPLQVRIPISVKRKFKTHAAMHGLEPNELFVEVWHHYEETKLSKNAAAGDQQ